MIQNGKFFNYYKINSPLCEYLDVEFSGPFISSDSTLLDAQVFWSDSSKPIVWVRSLPYSGEKIVSKAFSVSKELKEVISLEDSGFPYLSPNSQKIAFFSGDKVFVYDTVNWKKLREISGEKIVSIIWQDDNTLILGGEKTIRSWNIYSNVFIEELEISIPNNIIGTSFGDNYRKLKDIIYPIFEEVYKTKTKKKLHFYFENGEGQVKYIFLDIIYAEESIVIVYNNTTDPLLNSQQQIHTSKEFNEVSYNYIKDIK